MTDPTPVSLGYRWPAEWEPHAATWLSWPHNRNSWPGKFEPVPPQFAQFVRSLADCEPVHILAGGDAVLAEARSYVGEIANIHLHDVATNDAWCRDHGPTFLIGPPDVPPALVDWEYNAWGGKYHPYDADNGVPRQIAELQNRRRFAPGVILEGGAIDNNGCGTILTTERCLLHPARNPTLSLDDMERLLADYLGARKVLWLTTGELTGDDTDGHIDQMARFVNPTTVAVASEQDRNDPNYGPLKAMYEELRGLSDQEGRALELVPIPLPSPKSFQGQRIPASYLNFYIANGAVLVPAFDDPADEEAIRILAQLFPNRRVFGLPALDLAWGLGSFHCLTQQEPVWYESSSGLMDRVDS